MKRHTYAILASLAVLAVVLGACAPKPTPTPVPPTPVPATPTPLPATPTPTVPPAPVLKGTVTLWHAWKEKEIESLNEVIKAFQAKYPDVKFEVLYVPFDDLRGKYETAASTGGGPAVLIGAADWGPPFYEAKLVADLTPFLTKEFLDTIQEAALGAVKYKGAIIGLPQTIKGVLMFRNKTIIPEAPKTWEELVAAAKAATKGDVVGANLERGFFFSAAHLHGIGGKLMEENGDPAFNNEKGVEWVKLLVAFKEAGPAEYYTDNDVNLFKAGKAGIIIDGSWNLSALAEAIGPDNLAIDPWPKYKDGHLSGYVQTENIYLNPNVTGDDQKAAIAFILFFLSPEAQAILADPAKAAHIPAVKGVEVKDPLMKQAIEAFALGTPFPVIPEMSAYWAPMDTALKSVFDEGADPAAALQKAYESIVAKIKEIRGGQ